MNKISDLPKAPVKGSETEKKDATKFISALPDFIKEANAVIEEISDYPGENDVVKQIMKDKEGDCG